MVDITSTHGKILPNDRLPREIVDAFRLDQRLFYVLPDKLLLAIDQHLPDAISAEAIELEARLSRLLIKNVAVRDERPVSFIRLAASAKAVSPSDCEISSDPNAVAAKLTTVLQEAHEWSQAYLGWLVQCPEFQADLDTLRKLGCEDCSPLGTPPPYPADTGGKFDLLFRQDHQQLVRDLCKKWRLDGFATLDLPMPLEPHFAAVSPYNPNAREGGAAPFIPDIFPVKGRDHISERIRSSQPSDYTEHLREWIAIIEPTSKQSPRATSLARQFRLQHYWRVVQDRYTNEVAGKKKCLYQAFANFLDENVETIRKEVPKLSDCLQIPLGRWQ